MHSLFVLVPPKTIQKEELTACLPTLYSNLEDRNADVRKNACEAVLGFMLHVGFTNMSRACENIKVSYFFYYLLKFASHSILIK